MNGPIRGLTVIPVLDAGLGNQSYVVTLGGDAMVIDPSRNPAPYLRIAKDLRLRLAFSVETHLHADFISGSGELAAQGATILAPQAAELLTPYRPLRDGDSFSLGEATVRAIATPGHTPEHLAYLLLEHSTPRALFSGGALIPGGAARTDLIAPERTEPLARGLFRSVRQNLAELPDELEIYPTHGSGSFCSTGSDGHQTTTLGRERQVNPLLTTSNEDAFVRSFLGGLGSYPTYFRRLRSVNQRGARLVGPDPPELPRLTIDAFRREWSAGAVLIDTRPYPDFAAGHIRGSLSIALRPAFASWLGWLLPADRPLLFVSGPDQDRSELISQCLKIGYEDLRGELDRGIDAWRDAGLPLATIALRQPGDELGSITLDVRQASEWQDGHLPGARHAELGSLVSGLPLPSGPLTIYCGHGERAMSAASLIEAQGGRDLTVLDGGFSAWVNAGCPVAMG